MDVKCIALCKLVDVRKQLGTCYAAVRRQHSMGAASAHWQGSPYYMTHGAFQRVRVRTMLHGQVHVDFGNVHISHDAAHRELLGIGQGRGRCLSLCNGRRAGQHGVVLLRGFTLNGQLGVLGVRDNCGVGGFDVRVVFLTQKFSHQRVKQQSQRRNATSCRQQPALHWLRLRDFTTMKAAAPSKTTPPIVNIHVP